MAHERLTEHEEVKGPSERSFGVTFAVVFALVGTWPLTHAGGPRWWAIAVAMAFAALAWLRPRTLALPNRWWLKLGLALGHIVSPIALALLFYLVVTPTGLVMRLFGKAALRAGFEPQRKTYWVSREPPGPPADSLDNQF